MEAGVDAENTSQAKFKMTKTHFEYVSLHLFLNTINNEKVFKDVRIKPLMLQLVTIYALDILIKDPSGCYDTGFFGADATVNMRAALASMIDSIRPQMLPLVESFYVPDMQLNSCIGNSYGDIYEAQSEWAKDSRLNKNSGIPTYFDELMKPILNGGKL